MEPVLTRGGRGVFDVFVDGERIYSRHETRSFPDEGALLEELAARQSP